MGSQIFDPNGQRNALPVFASTKGALRVILLALGKCFRTVLFLKIFSRTSLSKIALTQSRLSIPGGQFITNRFASSSVIV